MDHPTIRDLGEAANDLVTWSNVSRVHPNLYREFFYREFFQTPFLFLFPGHLFL